MVCYSRLKHNVMVFLLLGVLCVFFFFFFFFGRCYSIFRLIICCKKRKECHRLFGLIHAMAFDEISHRMLEEC